ncbi:GMC family oxidoreductase [Synechococcus sp. CS-1325]|uniref:GMC oxidoreductase n=1 Tax=unclassified Synechococcus TaxID=2626047 RepID=UPI0021A3407E|nr:MULTISPECIES: GMC family oxidoreductase [unclassified Synechococcus]MCT0199044.1 GMC family oxidoreductase [Synechococcus sp. CS-1325]MCT0212512.1 GMC family oxidoreductase [Synechococcus sp. CS-1326]MCT0231559.1 GMC family oxidoreductase [Synechococcus sp. CS-1324]MCT0232029.1 GMC family oxidoreductase [Synechococcus sp. CS-1327]
MTASQQDDLSGFDAIVVGSGATGGVAAMVLADAGLSVLVLEAGPDLAAARAIGSEPLNMLRRLSRLSSGAQRLQAQHPGYWKANPDLFVDEGQNPYTTPPGRPFLWSRGRQVGGKSLTWGGITLRLSDFEFQAGERDGLGPSWPIGTADLAPYYGRLERLLGVHGQRDGLAQLPDGDYLDPYPFTPAERHLRRSIAAELDLPLIHSRGFALGRRSADQPWPRSSSQAGALGRALATGRVTVRANAVVSHVELAGGAGSGQDRARAVIFVERLSGQRRRAAAGLVVLCASSLESVRILLHSSAEHQTGGLEDPSGCLGRYLMDHISSCRFFAIPDQPAPSPPAELSAAGSAFIPNTLNLGDGDGLPFQRGYGIWAGVQRFDPPNLLKRRRQEAVGFLIGHGEVLPEAHNRLTLNSGAVDAWGLPTPHIDCRWGENETRLVEHMQARMAAVVAAAGGRIAPLEDLFLVPLAEPLLRRAVALSDGAPPPGYYIHELGGARMAAAPEQGVLDRWNRCWQAPNLLVTDGACWPSSGWQSPTLTEMAITWRACERAAADLVSGS